MRPESAEKERWDAWHDSGALSGRGSRERKRVRASRGVNLPIWQQGVTALRSFILGLFPSLKSVCLSGTSV